MTTLREPITPINGKLPKQTPSYSYNVIVLFLIQHLEASVYNVFYNVFNVMTVSIMELDEIE